MRTLLEHLPTVQSAFIALSTLWAARLTRPDRNYWPMLRVLWAVWGGVFAGTAWNSAQDQRGGLAVRIAFLVAFQCAVLYAVWFMRKRNHTARYIVLTVEGHEITLPIEEYERMANVIASLLNHGAMPAEWVPKLDAGLAEWHRLDAWRRLIQQQVLDRRRSGNRGAEVEVEALGGERE